ncbi:endothelin-converting protein [Methanosarcina sp. DH1]|uniref:M13 family metallopeptidase n=1 Tax=Methanosarcina sp. DH1 TaxID=2605695 RepID=UPI001E302542|nr:M13 family metallopeptidase [Methanosarcina sp. DH1]MCC4766201.1 endothelin-converting protein [Methanosarcina sp. DH1]
MEKKRVIGLFAFGIVLVNALTLVAFGSSETLRSNMSTSEKEKAFDPESMNLSVKPGDDFYEYAEGDWIKNHPVPPDKSRYGAFAIVEDRTYDRVKEILESAASNTSAPDGSLEQKIGKFYSMGMDNATLEKQHLDPIKGELKMINNISSDSDLQSVSTQMMEYGLDPFFSIYAAPDKKNSKIMIATLTQGGLGLPDRDFYFRQDNESIKIRDQYLTHVTRMFAFLGDSPEVAENNARTVMRMETRLANASFTNVEDHDEVETYNKMSLEELQAFAPGINWSCLFSSLGYPDVTEVNVRNPSFFKELSSALQDESIADWKTFLRWKLILGTSPYLSPEVEEEHFDFYGRKLNGQQEMKPRWKRVIEAENEAMGEAVGRIYVDRYFDPGSRAKMQDIVFNLKTAFGERIQNLAWMEPETKKEALKKLEVLDVQVGYPDEWLNYSELEVKNDSYAMNILRASKFKFYHGPSGLDRIGQPVNRKLWEMNPQETNAYADYNKIIIVFPAGILQPPFFNKDADDAVNYGAIGAIIGHEMTHHFDSQGRKFDASGNLTDWWTPEDANNFNNSTEVLVDEYNRFEVLPDLYVNGDLTLPENVADFGGLTVAYHAYKLSLKEDPEMIDGFTGDQRFFLSFTQLWRESDTNESLRTLALTDTHSPARFRVNGVVFNVPEFYRAFPNVKHSDKLYRPESERPVIW